jgi:hypothetical protein
MTMALIPRSSFHGYRMSKTCWGALQLLRSTWRQVDDEAETIICDYTPLSVSRWQVFVCTPSMPQSFVSKAISKGPIKVCQLLIVAPCMVLGGQIRRLVVSK